MDNLNESFFASLNFCAAESFPGRKKSAVNPQKWLWLGLSTVGQASSMNIPVFFENLVMALPPKDLIADMTSEPPETSGNFPLTVNVLSSGFFSFCAVYTWHKESKLSEMPALLRFAR